MRWLTIYTQNRAALNVHHFGRSVKRLNKLFEYWGKPDKVRKADLSRDDYNMTLEQIKSIGDRIGFKADTDIADDELQIKQVKVMLDIDKYVREIEGDKNILNIEVADEAELTPTQTTILSLPTITE